MIFWFILAALLTALAAALIAWLLSLPDPRRPDREAENYTSKEP